MEFAPTKIGVGANSMFALPFYPYTRSTLKLRSPNSSVSPTFAVTVLFASSSVPFNFVPLVDPKSVTLIVSFVASSVA